jgi:hypothetical protein
MALAAASAFAQSTSAPSSGPLTPAPSPSAPPAPVTTPRPAATVGPVLVDGKQTLIVTFGDRATRTFEASQAHAPPGSYFVANPGTMCLGAVRISAGTSVLLNAPVTSNGPFTLTRLGDPAGCAISISSTAGGAPATVVFHF